VLVDASPEALQRGVKMVKGSLVRAVQRGKLTEQVCTALSSTTHHTLRFVHLSIARCQASVCYSSHSEDM
jgi:3-hydroxyacyl-CoA dehydrogenase